MPQKHKTITPLPESEQVEHKSPRNKSIARAFFLIGFIEQFGTGINRIIQDCRAAGLPAPEFKPRPNMFRIIFRKARTLRQATGEERLSPPIAGTKSAPSREPVAVLRRALSPAALVELMQVANRTDRTKFRQKVIKPLLDATLLQMTIPTRPNSRFQKYVTTTKGRALPENPSG